MDKCISAVHLARWIEGTLGDADQESVSTHLAKCDDCRRAVGLAIVADEIPATALSPVAHAKALATVLGTGSVCADVNLWSKWVENTLTAEERAGVDSHLAACDDCRRTVTLSRIASETAVPPMTDTARRRLMDVVMPRRRVAAWVWQVAAAAAVVLAIGLYFILRPPQVPADLTKNPPLESPSAIIKGAPRDPDKVTTPETPRPEPPKPEVVTPKKDSPKVDPPKEVVRNDPPKGVTAPPMKYEPPIRHKDGALFAKVSVSDPKGMSLERSGKSEPLQAGTVGFGDVLVADRGGALVVDNSAVVVLERTSRVSVMAAAGTGTYIMLLHAGQAVIDTVGSSQEWDVWHNESGLSLTQVKGRLAVDASKGALTVGLVSGAATARLNSAAQSLSAGASLTMTERGVEKGSLDTETVTQRFQTLKPETVTLFAATFDGASVKVTSGTLQSKKPGFLEAGTGGPTSDMLWAGVKFPKPIVYEANIMLSIRYRSSAGAVAIYCDGFMRMMGRHGVDKDWLWQDLPLHGLQKDNNELGFGSTLTGIAIGVIKSEWLEIDEIKLIKRVE